jgi:predicted PurR-regulated permease PerM
LVSLLFKLSPEGKKRILSKVTDNTYKIPVYARATIYLVGLIAFFTVAFVLRGIIVPLIFATIIAVVLHPVVNFFVKMRINRVVAIAIVLLLTLIVILALGGLIISQVSRFAESWEGLVENFTRLLNQAISWASGYLDIKPKEIHEWILKTKGELLNTSTEALKQTIISVGTAVMILLLVPFYIFMILFYHPILIEFIHRLFGTDDQVQVRQVVSQIKKVIQSYLIGLIIEASIMAGLEITALLILGIEYAVLLGIIGALLNVIPYIGGIVAVFLPMVVALATESSPIYSLYILIIYYFIQLIDNNYLVPIIVASKVKINALFSVIVVLLGSALWGIPGMFLSIPLLAIVKLICDNVEPLKPWGFLLGDTMPPILKIKMSFKRIKKS